MNSRFPQRDVSWRTGGPSVHASGDGREGAYTATLFAAPSGGTCKVVIPAVSPNWETAFCSGAFTGSPGDRVLVMFDENKTPWVVSPPSPIVLGRQSKQGNATGSTGTSTTAADMTNIPSLTISVGNPSGAMCELSGAWSSFTSVAASTITWYYKIDSGAFVTLDRFLFNNVGQHMKSAVFDALIGPLTAGNHTITWGYSVTGSLTFDGNDTYSVCLKELP